MWFLRFSMDFNCQLLACGSRTGRVFVWDMTTVSPHAKYKVKRPISNFPTVSADPRCVLLVLRYPRLCPGKPKACTFVCSQSPSEAAC